MKKLYSRLSLFSREPGQALVPLGSGTAVEARRKLRSRGSQVELAEEFRKGDIPLLSSVAD